MRSIQSVLKSYTSHRRHFVLILLSASSAILLVGLLHVLCRLFTPDSTPAWGWTLFVTLILGIASLIGFAITFDEQLVSASDLAELPSDLREAATRWLSGSFGVPLSWGDLRKIGDNLHHEAFVAASKRTAQAALDHQRAAVNAPALHEGRQS